jgi:hypothetical protein
MDEEGQPGTKGDDSSAGPDVPKEEIPDLRWVQRRSWLGVFGGSALFFVLVFATMAWRPPGAEKLLLVLAPPGILALWGVYTSIRYWRCPRCGTGLPLGWYFLRKRRCLRCGRRFQCY